MTLTSTTLPPETKLPEATTDWLIKALAEDLPCGDITSDVVFSDAHQSKGLIESQQPLVVSGLLAAKKIFELVDPSIQVDLLVEDGDCLSKASPLMNVLGSTKSILKAERLALNLLQHLSGIATLTYQYAATISRTKAKITHTRKTLPGLRYLETQAVLHGGGILHRQSLSEKVMLKDNHILASGGITQAVNQIRNTSGQEVEIMLECETLEQVREALALNVTRIMLDNMSLNMMKDAVQLVNGTCLVEATGGVNLKTVLDIAQTGVDIISTSQITLSAPAADIHLELLN